MAERRIPPHHAPKESCGPPTPPRPFRSARAPPGRPASSLRRRSQSLPAARFAANRKSPAGRGGSANQEAGRGAVARQAGGRDQAVARGRSRRGARGTLRPRRHGGDTEAMPPAAHADPSRISPLSRPLPASGPRAPGSVAG
ncbi:CLK4-associating serine/arginine rich protein-like [Prinia subflava]|uniref:CLK4-associating serine/arginine rich protein-like n=1 Tax=Prinia subflava TaxID=208062 RepID=UPI002FE348BD